MAPEWEKLADIVKDCPNLVIGEFDVTTYEVPGLPIYAYPTLYLLRYNNKIDLLEFSGYDRTSENMKLFLK
jgi:hypothetical protein